MTELNDGYRLMPFWPNHKPRRLCYICGEELLQEANYGNERRDGIALGDFYKTPHPITCIPGAPEEKA